MNRTAYSALALTVAALLTGMGSDGAKGLLALSQAGLGCRAALCHRRITHPPSGSHCNRP